LLPVIWLKISVFYLVLVSLYANFATDAGAMAAADAGAMAAADAATDEEITDFGKADPQAGNLEATEKSSQ